MIIIRTVGNPSLYRSLAASMTTETRHRTASGAIRHLLRMRGRIDRWAYACGRWGHVEIWINGREMTEEEGAHELRALAYNDRDAVEWGQMRAEGLLRKAMATQAA